MTGTPVPDLGALTAALARISSTVPVSASLFDYRGRRSWEFDGDRWFHAASTIKIAVLAALYPTLSARGLSARHRLPIRNQFLRTTGTLEWVDFTGMTPFGDSDPAMTAVPGSA